MVYRLYVYLNGEWGVYSFTNEDDRSRAILMCRNHGLEWMVRD